MLRAYPRAEASGSWIEAGSCPGTAVLRRRTRSVLGSCAGVSSEGAATRSGDPRTARAPHSEGANSP
eukprot:11487768-Alexandrium_andersonii.AAC.1